MAASPPATALLDVLTIERPEQLKALGHPLRLRVLELLGEGDAALTNRELAQRLAVDPGHLHFHVRMLLKAGLIDRSGGGNGREKPYRAVARVIRVAPELLSSGPATDIRAAMLEQVQAGWAKFGPEGRFRSTQLTVRLDPERLTDLFKEFVEQATELEDDTSDPLVITVVSHPQLSG